MTTAPAFWWRRAPGPAAIALWPLAQLWGAGSTWRMGRPAAFRPPVPVVCVGNFVVGGAGKTPTSIALARIAGARGLKPGFVASGYGGSGEGPILVDPASHGADIVGDEALLLAEVAPTVVCRDRVAAAKRLLGEGIDIIFMDDGLQNPWLAKDLVLAVVDAAAGIGNGMVMPAGPLRAPLLPQLRRIDALVVIGDGEAADPLIRAAARAGRATLRGRLKPVRVKEWRKEPVLAFAGIGRPEKFYATLGEMGVKIGKTMNFPDHHRFTDEEADRLIGHAEAADLRLVTTEKDLARLKGGKGEALARLRERAEALPVILDFDNPTAVGEMIDELGRKIAIRVG